VKLQHSMSSSKHQIFSKLIWLNILSKYKTFWYCIYRFTWRWWMEATWYTRDFIISLLISFKLSSICSWQIKMFLIPYINSVPTEATETIIRTLLPSNLRNPKVHHRVHKSPPLVPILSQIDPVHTIPSYLSQIYLNIVHPPTSYIWYSFCLQQPNRWIKLARYLKV
jgi:hypothetical protein